jgi:hypothetical protein
MFVSWSDGEPLLHGSSIIIRQTNYWSDAGTLTTNFLSATTPVCAFIILTVNET